MTRGRKALLALSLISAAVLASVWYLESEKGGELSTVDAPVLPTPEPSSSRSSLEKQKVSTVEETGTSGASNSEGGSLSNSRDAQTDRSSPFATVVEELDEVGLERDVSVDAELFEETPSTSASEGTEGQDDNDAVGDQQDQTSLSVPVAVPESYPVSEAARYFVPKKDRRPGNLGGPPPLDFPGGPNDSGSDSTETAPPLPQ